jgi:hypothetical protein
MSSINGKQKIRTRFYTYYKKLTKNEQNEKLFKNGEEHYICFLLMSLTKLTNISDFKNIINELMSFYEEQLYSRNHYETMNNQQFEEETNYNVVQHAYDEVNDFIDELYSGGNHPEYDPNKEVKLNLNDSMESDINLNYDDQNDTEKNHFTNTESNQDEINIEQQILNCQSSNKTIEQFSSVEKRKKEDHVIDSTEEQEQPDENESMFQNEIERDIQPIIETLRQSFASGTLKYHEYAFRCYLQFYKQYIQDDYTWSKYQPGAYPIKIGTYLRFLYVSRKKEKYSYKTVRDCFVRGLHQFIMKNARYQPSPITNYKEWIQKLLKGLYRKYGDTTTKVAPLYNHDLQRWSKKLDYGDPNQNLINAIIYFGRYTGLRGDSIECIQLCDIEIEQHFIHDQLILTMEIFIRKEKFLEHQGRTIHLHGRKQHKICPVVQTVYYLWHVRKIFIECSHKFKNFLYNGNFQIIPQKLNETLFQNPNTHGKINAKQMTQKLKHSSEQILQNRYSMRSLRSGCVMSILLQSLISKGRIDEADQLSCRLYLGHLSMNSMLYYVREAKMKYVNMTSLQNLENDDCVEELIKRRLHYENQDDNEQNTQTNNNNDNDLSNNQPEKKYIKFTPTKTSNTPYKDQYTAKRVPKELRQYFIQSFPEVSEKIQEEKSRDVPKQQYKAREWGKFWGVCCREHLKRHPELNSKIQQVIQQYQIFSNGAKKRIKMKVVGNDVIDQWERNSIEEIDLLIQNMN